MTRKFDGLVQCPECKAFHTAETPFERWMRDNEHLDSRIEGIVCFDCDVLLHKYKVAVDKKGSRDIQCLMFIEVKSHAGDVSESQRDTLGLFDQVLRNRHPNIHSQPRRQVTDHEPLASCKSAKLKRIIKVRLYGGHLLQLQANTPEDSEWMMWDRKTIDVQQLLALLRFEIDPDRLRPIDWRRRSSCFSMVSRQKTFLR